MSNDPWERAVTRLRDDLTDAETRIVQLEEALRFYAAEENYQLPAMRLTTVDMDRGARAKAVLFPSEATRSEKEEE